MSVHVILWHYKHVLNCYGQILIISKCAGLHLQGGGDRQLASMYFYHNFLITTKQAKQVHYSVCILC